MVSSEMEKVIKVALPTGNFDMPLSYLAKVEVDEKVEGRRVLVPLQNRVITGIALGIAELDENIGFELKPIIEFIDKNPIFDSAMMQMIKWMANYYMCPIGEVFKAALPPNISPKSIAALELISFPGPMEANKLAKSAKNRFKILQELEKQNKAVKISTLQKKLGFIIDAKQIEKLQEAGYIRYIKNIQTQAKLKTAYKLTLSNKLTDEELNHLASILEKKAPKQYRIIEELFLAKKQKLEVFQTDLLKKVNATSATINPLIEKSIIERDLVQISINSEQTGELATGNEAKLNLTDEQETALNTINNAIDENIYKPFLLHGVTGSGKTLIYIHAIQKAINQGKSALLLVPEISLTPQLLDRFEQVFPNQIVAIHSKITNNERLESFNKIINNEAKIVIGARSAIFAPMQNMGIIIVDEEHELSYKQDSPRPRYHGRDTALVRASYQNAVCILGSATPSFESLYNARVGKYQLLEIKYRADKAIMPDVQIIDMLDAKITGNVNGAYSITLVNEIIEKVKKKEGIILFLNRRGYAPIMECSNCGYIPICTHCDVTLTLHKKYKQLRCHYCGYTEKAPEICPNCGGEFSELGRGTQRIEEELIEIMQDNGLTPVIQRIDLDTTSKKGAFRKILTDFAKGKTDILIGTQMVAKGLDFSRCTLVGVINADTQLFIDNFRSSERTLQLLTQVSGRAGRSQKSGIVIIQTNHPDNPAVFYAKDTNYMKFFEEELKSREQTKFPPFSRFCVVEFYSKDYHLVRKASQFFAEHIPKEDSIIVYPPLEPYMAKVKDTYRIIMPIKSMKDKDISGKKLRQALRSAQFAYTSMENDKVVIKIDVDAYSMI